MKKEAYYFSHDANAQDDPKCMVLIDQLGMEGYGIFWALIEKLRAERDYRLPLTVCSSFARRWGTSKEKVEAVVLNYSLFKIEEEMFFYSERLKTSMEMRTITARNSAAKRWGSGLNVNAMQTHANALPPHANAMQNDANKRKEIKGKENKITKEGGGFKTKEIKEKMINDLTYEKLQKFIKDKNFIFLTEEFDDITDEVTEKYYEFYLARQKMSRKITTWGTIETHFKQLSKFKTEPIKALQQSIDKGWQGLFEVDK